MEWSLGKRIKMARIERGISQQQLARDAGLHQSHLSMIESDKHDPSATIVRTLAQVLRVNANYLLGLSSDLREEPKKDNERLATAVA
jgi:transcriptional regulator with XRE-family HTH domain